MNLELIIKNQLIKKYKILIKYSRTMQENEKITLLINPLYLSKTLTLKYFRELMTIFSIISANLGKIKKNQLTQ